MVIAAALFAVMAVMAAVSAGERERRATRVAAMLAIALPVPYFVVGLYLSAYAAATVVLATVVAAVLFLIPTGRPGRFYDETPAGRIDERDVMFSRRLLQPGTDRFDDYYAMRPGNRELDDAFRAQPGLMAKGSKAYDPITFFAADANFEAVKQFHPIVDGEPAGERVECDPDDITRFLKTWALNVGAVSAGVTELRDYHLYSHVGRGPDFGEPVELPHGFALALTVEMTKEMIDSAPLGPTLMESAQQYLTSGAMATQMAAFIRRLGYSARAHIDGNYRVVCPLVARDAGLGEIGRMGLLMTPRLGPRVRIAVVTTDLQLVPNNREHDESMMDFCRICKKCADVCPSHSISFDDPEEVDGVRRWQIDQASCFTFWCTIGTDCARCMRACPYSHPDNLLHNMVRAGIKKSALFRRIALRMDDLFYGRKPPPSDVSDWLRVRTRDSVSR
jgi:ferredoxin